jgi:hypothetical protein
VPQGVANFGIGTLAKNPFKGSARVNFRGGTVDDREVEAREMG